MPTTVSDPQKSNEPQAFTPSDAFGLLRSYSRHRDFVRLALLAVFQAAETRGDGERA